MKTKPLTTNLPSTLVVDIRTLVHEARASVAVAVNSGITMLYWRIGKRVNEDVLKGERAEYGKQIVATLSRQLVLEYGTSYSEKNLRRIMQFGEAFPDEQIVVSLIRQLSWSHFKELIPLDKPHQRDFYSEMCRLEKWNVRTLRKKIGSMLYERTAISKKPDELIRYELDQLRHEDQLSPDMVFRDPYLLDFLGLSDRYIEKDLEDAILREIETFLLELGVGFTFVARQKGSLIEGLYRRDIPEYPEEAIREAIVNAVAHRDYSNFARGSYIQIRLFADRMEIQSPGGLYGTVTLETLEEEQSTRNRTLVRLLEDLHLVENRGSGIKAMLGAMRSANLEPPRFQDRRSSFLVIMRNLTLMNSNAISWLNRFADKPLNDRQRLALVYLRHNQQITNFDYQRLAHVDSVTASRELRGLVQTGLTSQHSSRRWTHYMLNVSIVDKVEVTLPLLPEDKVLDYVRSHGSITRKQCAGLLDLKDIEARTLLHRMRDKGILMQIGYKKGSCYKLPE